MQLTCPHCQSLNRSDAKFCLSCGAPLAAIQAQSAASPGLPPAPTMACPQCGKAVSVKAKFCNYCGQPFSPSPAVAPPAAPAAAPTPGLPATPPPSYAAPTYTPTHKGLSRRRKATLIVAGVIVGAILGILALSFLQEALKKTTPPASSALPTPSAAPSATPTQAMPLPTNTLVASPRDCPPRPRGESHVEKYSVEKPDETLDGIAEQYHMRVGDLTRLNDLRGDYRPQPGDCLWVRVK